MLARSFSLVALVLASTAAAACTASPSDDGDAVATEDALISGPGAKATDQRVPELGADLTVVRQSKISMADAVRKVGTENGPVIEAKFELGHDGKLALSLYPVGAGLALDSERNVFQELAGDPTATAFRGDLSTFEDDEHVLRSSRDLMLVQLSRLGVADAVAAASSMGKVFWAIPTIRNHRAGYGVYALTPSGRQAYRFIDGRGSDEADDCLEEIGSGPGSLATDARHPEVGSDLTVVRASKISMARALAQAEAAHGPAIEAKFELDHDGKLSLSVYPIGKGIDVDAERNSFFELAGDPTAPAYAPSKSEFKMPDFEHVARSARDLTLVQTARMTLREAVDAVDEAMPGGFVYWAIPTIRGTRSGYGVYTLGTDNKAHYFFVN
ncbi:MAG: hypothetical protein KIT84_11475 [Labilithrix sp.]|nr:hypothetical protein [Labilithrix sp.]MCW5811630.1 hypothetical protein [Labilithrix sp.]